jgi:hypothetical protein
VKTNMLRSRWLRLFPPCSEIAKGSVRQTALLTN